MNDTYDLDINKYNETELLEFLNITDTNNLSESSITISIEKMKSKLDSSSVIDSITDNSLHMFLNNARLKLIKYISNSNTIVNSQPISDRNTTVTNSLSGANHDIITNPPIPVSNVYNYKFPAGVVNPLERRTITRVISIDSRFRKNYTTSMSSNFTWALTDTQYKVISLKLVSAELPLLWYMISNKDNSNTFKISLFNITLVPDNSYDIVIPGGNYSAGQMTLAINHALINTGGARYIYFDISAITTKSVFRLKTAQDNINNMWPADPSIDIADPVSVNYSPDFYYTIHFNEYIRDHCNTEAHYKSLDYNMRPSLGKMLGFTRPTCTASLQDEIIDNTTQIPSVTYYASIISEQSYGSDRSYYVFIAVDDYNNNNIIDSVISASHINLFLGTNILGRIGINEGLNSVIVNTPSDRIFKQRDYMGPVSLNNFGIKILDKFGGVIDLNNNDISLALELTILY